eukprot:3861898-Pleurochrysis_carterae.AAC.1
MLCMQYDFDPTQFMEKTSQAVLASIEFHRYRLFPPSAGLYAHIATLRTSYDSGLLQHWYTHEHEVPDSRKGSAKGKRQRPTADETAAPSLEVTIRIQVSVCEGVWVLVWVLFLRVRVRVYAYACVCVCGGGDAVESEPAVGVKAIAQYSLAPLYCPSLDTYSNYWRC